jgi:Tfp pilus assembly protein PilO
MNEKQFTIIWVVALVIILLAGSASIWYLQFDVLVEKRAILDNVKKQVEIARQKERKIKDLEKSIESLTKKSNELATHIPNLDRAEYDVFAELLDDLRRKAGVNVPRAAWTVPGRPVPIPGRTTPAMPDKVHKVQYDLTVNGSFYQLLRYINLIEQQKRFIGVENFTITKSGGEAAPGTKAAAAPKRDLKLTIYSYTYKLPAQPFIIEAEEPRSGKSTDIPD